MTDALRSLSGRTPSYGDATIVSLPAVSQRARMHRPSGELSARSMELLEARGLDAELCVRLDLQTASAPDGGGDWISIPFVKGGAVVNHKYRRVTKSEGGQNFAQDKGGAQVFWNYDAITDPTLARVPLVITEGEFDAMASIQSGFARSVSVPGGAPQQAMGDKDSGKYAFVADSLDDLADVTDIILAVDGDGPGVALMNDLALRLGRARCRYVVYHDGCKDLGDVLLKHGQRGVAEALNGARWVGVKGLFRMSELPPAPAVEAYRSGVPGLDEHYRLCRGDFSVITGIPGHGKALALDTPIPTPGGWTTMGDLAVGDLVYADDGRPCRVTAATDVMIGRPCYRLRFDDGTTVVADAEHLWLTNSEKARRSAIQQRKKRSGREQTKPRGTDQRHKMTFPAVVTTAEIAATLRSQGKFNHHVALCGPVSGMDAALPVDPYTLGAWLGDGASESGSLTCFDEEIVEKIAANGTVVSRRSTVGAFGLMGLVHGLRALGLLSNKHIPDVYLNAKVDDRLALLRGLMDTDGHAHPDRTCEFTTVNDRLASGFHQLACGLGFKATVCAGRATLNGRDIGPKWRVRFVTHVPAFTLLRKLANQGVGQPLRTAARFIVACDPIESVPVRCIQVDSPSRLYLCTRSFLPTHNTTFVNELACRMAERHGWTTAFASFEQDPLGDHRRALRTWFNRRPETEQEPDELARADMWIDRHFSFIVPSEDEDSDLMWLLEMAAASVIRHGCDMLVVDPWNELDHAKPRDQTLTEYVGWAIRQLKKFAKKYGVHLIVVAHPTKISKDKEGKVPMPTLYDISDSAAWFNKSDVGVIVHREDGLTKVRVAKAKYHDRIGMPGTVLLSFDKWSGRYEGSVA